MNGDTNKVAIVTGASRGIGAAIAERLAADGFTVVVNYAGGAADAEALVRRSRRPAAAPSRPRPMSATQPGGPHVRCGAGSLRRRRCAGQQCRHHEAGEHRRERRRLFDSQIAINLKGSFNTLREAAKRLREGGRIVNLSSSVVGLYQPGYAVYAATKAGVEAMTHVMAKELRGRNITVNAVAPGPTATSLFLDGKPQAVIDT
jgi:3-oxoacyl-[acyl-carrier protein] reductase